jgi:hypothetical protein
MERVPRKLDRIDIAILNELQLNARITNAELARAVNLSTTGALIAFARSKSSASSSSR